jgi:hypothetical protein
VIHSTLLRRQQQQKTQCFVHVSHSVNTVGESGVNKKANRIERCLQLL